jgi:glycerol-3-phosphate O-acyltransferase/dihydroxyacetone phosphate acyltransferase
VDRVKSLLVEYNNLLITSKLNNQTLSDLPLPQDLDPSKPIPLPSRFSTLILLIRDTLSVLIRVPFFLLPMVIHLPMYYVAKMGENIVKEELETQAQMKIVFGMLFSLAVYPFWFFLLWVFLGFTSFGAVVAGAAVYLFNMSHKSLVDENYER